MSSLWEANIAPYFEWLSRGAYLQTYTAGGSIPAGTDDPDTGIGTCLADAVASPVSAGFAGALVILDAPAEDAVGTSGHQDCASPPCVGSTTLPGNQHIWHLYVIRVPRRDAVLARLAEAGIGAGIHYPVPIHLQGAFRQLGHRPSSSAEERDGAELVPPRVERDLGLAHSATSSPSTTADSGLARCPSSSAKTSVGCPPVRASSAHTGLSSVRRKASPASSTSAAVAPSWLVPRTPLRATGTRQAHGLTAHVAAAFAWAAERARAGEGPSLVELVCMRMCGHAHHDDMLYLGKDPQVSWEYPPVSEGGYANRDLYAFWAARDPISTYSARLVGEGIVERAQVDAYRREVDALVEAEAQAVIAAPWPRPEEAGAGVFAGEPARVRRDPLDLRVRESIDYDPPLPDLEPGPEFDRKGKTFLEGVMLGVRDALRSDPRVFVYGEDVGGPYGNAFLLLRPLLEEFGAARLQPAIREALDRDIPHPHAVRQILESQRRAEGCSPALPVELPDDPRVRDLTVRPHALENYDALTRDLIDHQEHDDHDPSNQS